MAILADEPLKEATVAALICIMAAWKKESEYIFVMELEFFRGSQNFRCPGVLSISFVNSIQLRGFSVIKLLYHEFTSYYLWLCPTYNTRAEAWANEQYWTEG